MGAEGGGDGDDKEGVDGGSEDDNDREEADAG